MTILKKESNDSEIQKKESKTSHFKMTIFLFIVGLIVIGIGAVYFYAQKPAQGIIKNTLQNQELGDKSGDVPEVFTGKYLSFLYDSSFVLKSHDIIDRADAIILEQAYLSEKGAISKKIGLMMRNLPTHNLEDCPDFKMRLISSKKYKKEDFILGSISGISFTVIDQGTFDKTFFLLKGDYLAIITITAPALGDEKLENEANSIVKSVSWLK